MRLMYVNNVITDTVWKEISVNESTTHDSKLWERQSVPLLLTSSIIDILKHNVVSFTHNIHAFIA